LHVAQPALSRQIQDLEREIGFNLFERLPRGVKISAGENSSLRMPDVVSFLTRFELFGSKSLTPSCS
jgi:hypothetical protein